METIRGIIKGYNRPNRGIKSFIEIKTSIMLFVAALIILIIPVIF